MAKTTTEKFAKTTGKKRINKRKYINVKEEMDLKLFTLNLLAAMNGELTATEFHKKIGVSYPTFCKYFEYWCLKAYKMMQEGKMVIYEKNEKGENIRRLAPEELFGTPKGDSLIDGNTSLIRH